MNPYGYTKDEFLAKYADCFLFYEAKEFLPPKIVAKVDKMIEWLPESVIERIAFDYNQGMEYNGLAEMCPAYYYDYAKKDIVIFSGIEYAFYDKARWILRMLFDDHDIMFGLNY